MNQFESSIVGTAIQFSGTTLVMILCAILQRSVQKRYLSYWTISWCALSFALASLLVGFLLQHWDVSWRDWSWFFFGLYCLGEYSAGFLLIAGCRSLGTDYRLTRADSIWFAPAALVSALLPGLVHFTGGTFNGLMIAHSLIMACLFATAFAVLYATRGKTHGAGVGVMMASLFVLTVAFLQYAPLCGFSHFTGQENVFPHLKYSSLYDLMLEMLLAFGMVMVVMEHVHAELQQANRELRSTGSRLKHLADCDPLTGALNRRAFDDLIRDAREQGGRFTGCVAVLDLDQLKPINDTLGHHIGDRAIQMVAQTLRTIIRPDDFLFRWGGDEFLVLWLGQLKESDAAVRLARLNDVMAQLSVESGITWPIEPTVSHGLASFSSLSEVDSAIQRADAQMYASKAARRTKRVLQPSFP